jgi:hypothetical protein
MPVEGMQWEEEEMRVRVLKKEISVLLPLAPL